MSSSTDASGTEPQATLSPSARARQALTRRRIFRIERKRLAEVRHRTLPLLKRGEDHPTRRIGEGGRGLEFDGPFGVGQRALSVADAGACHGAVSEGGCVVRLRGERAVVVGDGAPWLVAAHVQATAVGVGDGVIGLELDRPVIFEERVLVVPARGVNYAASVVSGS